MKIEKEVYPPIKDESEIMIRAKKNLLENDETFLLQPNEEQFILQCAWVLGFMEGKKKPTTLRGEVKNETTSPDSSS